MLGLGLGVGVGVGLLDGVLEHDRLVHELTGADEAVISHFAYFHDCMRENEQIDPGHGLRGAEFAEAHRDSIRLDELQFHQLFEACKHHTDGKPTTCETISSCWDADRLDLGRVGTTPKSSYLGSSLARDPNFIEMAVMRSKKRFVSEDFVEN